MSPKPCGGQGCGSLARSRPSARSRSSCTCIQTVWYESMRGEVNHSCSPSSIRCSAARRRRGSLEPVECAGDAAEHRARSVRRASAGGRSPTSRTARRSGRWGRCPGGPASRGRRGGTPRSTAGTARSARDRDLDLARRPRPAPTLVHVAPSPVIRERRADGRHEAGFDELGDDDVGRRPRSRPARGAAPRGEGRQPSDSPSSERHGGRCYRVGFCGS